MTKEIYCFFMFWIMTFAGFWLLLPLSCIYGFDKADDITFSWNDKYLL